MRYFTLTLLLVAVMASISDARVWTDSTTKNEIDAEYVRKIGDKVVLRKDGKLYTVSIAKLSAEDRKFVETQPASAKGILSQYKNKPKEIIVDTSGSDRFSKAIRSDPNNPLHYVRRGMARIARGEHEEAINDYSKALSLDPNNAQAFNGRGRAYSKLGDAAKAHGDYNKAIEIDPEYPTAHRYRADNMPGLVKTEEGKKMLEETRSELKKKWSNMVRDNQTKTPWQPLNATKGPVTDKMLALGLAKRDYEYAELLGARRGLSLGYGIGGGGGGYGITMGSSGAVIGNGVAINGPLTLYPETVVKGNPLTLAADTAALTQGMPPKKAPNGRVVYAPGTKTPMQEEIASVDFYRDVNGDGQLDEAKDQYLGSDDNGQDGYSIEVSSWPFALGNNTYFAQPKGPEGSNPNAGPDYNTVAESLEKAAVEQRELGEQADKAAESGLDEAAVNAMRGEQKGIVSTSRKVSKAIKKSAPEVAEELKGVNRASLDIDRQLSAAAKAPGAESAPNAQTVAKQSVENAERLEAAAEKLRQLAATQSTAVRGTPAVAPGSVIPGKGEGPGKGGPGYGGGGGDGDDNDVIIRDRVVERAVDYLDDGDYDRAIVDYDSLLVDEPDNDYYLRQRAGAQLARGGYDYAIRDYDRLVEHDTRNAELYYNRGCAKLAVGKLDEAVADFTMSIQLDETKNLAYTNRGVSLARKREYKKAIENFNTAISINPGDQLAYRNRALAYKKIGELKKSEADLLKLRDLLAQDEVVIK